MPVMQAGGGGGLDYISERYCAGLKTKSLKIQT